MSDRSSSSFCPETPRRPRRARRGRRLIVAAAGSGALALAGAGASGALASTGHHHRGHGKTKQEPILVSVFSPGNGDRSGAGGVGFIVDLSLDSTAPKYDHLLSTQAGYKPYFNDPSSTTFHPGPDPGAPGLVVLLSSTPNKPGTPFAGPRTNLAGLFQINGVARVNGNRAETWNTWQPGKPLFGTGPTTLTVYVVKGTAPAVVSAHQTGRISNIVRVHFSIRG